MTESMSRSSLGEESARNLAEVTKTPPQMGSLSPRWLSRMLSWAEAEAGIYRVNRVRVLGSEFERIETRVDEETRVLDPNNLRAVPLFRGLDAGMLAALAPQFRAFRSPRARGS